MPGGSPHFARRVSMRVKPGRATEFVKVFQQKVVPSAVKEPGLRRLYLLRSIGPENEFVGFSLWNSEKDAETYVKSGHYKSNVEKLELLLDGEPIVEKFTVEKHAVGRSVRPSRKK